MKIQLETIDNSNRSFSMILNPGLSDLFYWHFHPEFELVYIKGATGPRHVGDHISVYEHSDLVLIGSNIPHLNFDYGVKTDYREAVLHFNKELIDGHINKLPELSSIAQLFELSRHGIVFHGEIKDEIGGKLFELDRLNPFQRYLQVLELLRMLTEVAEITLLNKEPYVNNFSERDQGRLRAIHAFVDMHYQRKIDLSEVANVSNLTEGAFCRYFKKASNCTFVQFLNRYRITQAKRLLTSGETVSDACFQTGFESLSYFNRTFKKIAGENPRTFRKRHVQ